VILQTDLDGNINTTADRALLGDPASGVAITQLPEPGGLLPIAAAAAGLLARRRRRNVRLPNLLAARRTGTGALWRLTQ
jgi:hypothetical protein